MSWRVRVPGSAKARRPQRSLRKSRAHSKFQIPNSEFQMGTSEVRESAEFGRKVRRGPRLRQASFKDHQQIAGLESRYGLVSKNYDEWSHLWLGNPVYKEVQPDWSIGWVLEDHDHRIVGTMGNIPLLYEFEGKKILAASGRHWVAEPSYRSASLILLDMVVNQ